MILGRDPWRYVVRMDFVSPLRRRSGSCLLFVSQLVEWLQNILTIEREKKSQQMHLHFQVFYLESNTKAGQEKEAFRKLVSNEMLENRKRKVAAIQNILSVMGLNNQTTKRASAPTETTKEEIIFFAPKTSVASFRNKMIQEASDAAAYGCVGHPLSRSRGRLRRGRFAQ